MISRLFSAIGSLFSRTKTPAQLEKDKAKAERKRVKQIVARQKKIIKQEINQTWRIAVGHEFPLLKKDTFLIADITRRNVWMENNFLFNQITSHFPNSLFHHVSNYVLKWQPPGSNFQVIIPLDDPGLQENAILVYAKLTAKEQKKIIFLCTTLDSTMEIFAPNVHPASLVSYR